MSGCAMTASRSPGPIAIRRVELEFRRRQRNCPHSIHPSLRNIMTEALIVACPACNTLNRAPREKLASGSGKCGQCGAPLFEGHPVSLTAASFERHAVKSDIPLLVDFWAPWCGPCKAMAPQFEKAAGHVEPRVRFAKVNTDEEQQLAGRFGIQ